MMGDNDTHMCWSQRVKKRVSMFRRVFAACFHSAECRLKIRNPKKTPETLFKNIFICDHKYICKFSNSRGVYCARHKRAHSTNHVSRHVGYRERTTEINGDATNTFHMVRERRRTVALTCRYTPAHRYFNSAET